MKQIKLGKLEARVCDAHLFSQLPSSLDALFRVGDRLVQLALGLENFPNAVVGEGHAGLGPGFLPLLEGAESIVEGLIVLPLELQNAGEVVHPGGHAVLVVDSAEQIYGALVAFQSERQVVFKAVDDSQVVVAVGDSLQVADLRGQPQAEREALQSPLVVRPVVVNGAEA